ncbi:hypothetical protein SK128_024875 [Halocaridina rubra]|uniref:Uncharacterized protein n=1 Tax=Halocaridina rubra TaxID=373956 RepID=A0AAN9A6Z9_HALRR
MAKDTNLQRKVGPQEVGMEAFQDSSSGENISTVALELHTLEGSNTAMHSTSNPSSTSSGSGWSANEIPLLSRIGITDSEDRDYQVSNPIPGLPRQLQPFWEKLEYERSCLLKCEDSPDESLKIRWFNMTSERQHLFKITYCQNSRFDVAADIRKMELLCDRILREAICPDPIMSYLRRAINQVLRFTPMAKRHLVSENGHSPNVSAYPSQSAELMPVDYSGSTSSEQVFPLSQSSSGKSKSIPIAGSQKSGISGDCYSSDSGPSASTGAVLKKAVELPRSLSPRNDEYFSLGKSPISYSQFMPRAPANSVEDFLSVDSEKKNSPKATPLVFEFADALELGIPDRTLTLTTSRVLTLEQAATPREQSGSPVRFYLGDDKTLSSSSPSED